MAEVESRINANGRIAQSAMEFVCAGPKLICNKSVRFEKNNSCDGVRESLCRQSVGGQLMFRIDAARHKVCPAADQRGKGSRGGESWFDA